MLSKEFQIIYQSEQNNPNQVHWIWTEEAEALSDVGFSVATTPDSSAKALLFRGGRSFVMDFYEKDNRFINNYKHVIAYSSMFHYYPQISDLSIDTFFVDDLNEDIEFLIKERSWKKAFIKKDIKALEHVEEGKSIWPDTSFKEMRKLYNEMQIEGKYAIRKYIEKKNIEQEERYWVLNGNIYHRNNNIPNVVIEGTKRLNKLGSRYYTIDATPDFIVEVNPGESSDRHAVNSAALFASWFKKEFLK